MDRHDRTNGAQSQDSARHTEQAGNAPRHTGGHPPRIAKPAVTYRSSLRASLHAGREQGLATAEYAIATIAAAGFAGLLIVVLKSGKVQGLLSGIIESALSVV